jgi:hypothetical protein
MTQAKRYIVTGGTRQSTAYCVENPVGDYVRYNDHNDVCEENERLRGRLAAVERIINDYWQGVGPTDIAPALRALFPLPGTADQPPAALPHAESADDPLRAALFAVWQTLDGGRWNHEGDEESGECDEGCHACKWEALREQTRLALRDESPQPAVSLDCRTLNEIVNDLPANRRVSIAERARELIQQLAAQPPAVHVHRWVLPAPPVTASNYFCGDCGYFPGPEASTADPTPALHQHQGDDASAKD